MSINIFFQFPFTTAKITKAQHASRYLPRYFNEDTQKYLSLKIYFLFFIADFYFLNIDKTGE